MQCGWTCDYASVCVCVFICVCVRVWEIERERERTVYFKICTLTERTDEICELSACFHCSRSLPVRKKHCYMTQNTTTASGSNAMIFNTGVSEAHAAARVKSLEAADVDNKACVEVFQHLLSNSPWTCDILKMCCLRRTHMHTLFSGKGKYSC